MSRPADALRTPEMEPATHAQLPRPDFDDAAAWVAEHLGDLTLEGPSGVVASPRFRGGQTAADAALEAFDVSGYARSRSGVWPPSRRGASGLSPYIRYGLLPLPRVWRAAGEGGDARDVKKFQDELLWQEYARHLYARVGGGMRSPLRYDVPKREPWTDPWPREMGCMDAVVGELERDGWAVNQTRMWLASQWTIRAGHPWRDGDDAMFAHLLDGSRAANRLGWQWTVGAGTGKPYGFSRWQVEKRAPAFCKRCALREACPIQDWPEEQRGSKVDEDPRVRRDPDVDGTTGPRDVAIGRWGGASDDPETPEAVWLTAESLGDADPALAAHPDLPAVFVFDAPLLARLRLSGKRLVFLAETLADLASRRTVELHRGDPVAVLSGRAVAATYAPIPGWRRRASSIAPVEVHPWPWLAWPRDGSLASYSAWRKQLPR
ncbi:MAG: FAD-binding domain-containing protein [Solirubrobacteraceae bacterium]|nr:FAD-binding domain-containing protein [Solirubrobacteraceae bacterium]